MRGKRKNRGKKNPTPRQPKNKVIFFAGKKGGVSVVLAAEQSLQITPKFSLTFTDKFD